MADDQHRTKDVSLLPRSVVSCAIKQRISAACGKAHAKIDRKIENLTPCKNVTLENFNLKLCTRDKVGDNNSNIHANLGANRCSGGFSPDG